MVDKLRNILLAAALFFAAPAFSAGEQEPLAVEIKTGQTIVANDQDFSVDTKIENRSGKDQILHMSQCAYSAMQWAADNPLFRVKELFCKKNTLIDITLKPGQSYEKPLTVHISLQSNETVTLSPLTFRLGLRLWHDSSSKIAPSAAAGSILWSNPLTVKLSP